MDNDNLVRSRRLQFLEPGAAATRLVRDELRLVWKVDEIRRQQQGAVTKSCSQVGQFPAASCSIICRLSVLCGHSEMAEEIAFAFLIADEIEAEEIPLIFNEDGLQQRRLVTKIPGFVEEVVPMYSVTDFKSHFRLSRGQMEGLMTTLGPFYTNRQQTKLPVSNSVLACLWTLSYQESYRGVADRFNISKSTMSTHLHHFCFLVNTHLSHHISWPTGEALLTSQLQFQTAGFPNTVCAVDGCHIPIVRPHCNYPIAYYNLTGFCDSERRFCHVNVGHPGSWHDARAFLDTDVARLLEEDPQVLVPEGMHIIGDSAYPLSRDLMKPYRDNGHLTARQRRFNYAARVAIEHAFGILKSKFRRFKCLHMKKVSDISAAVTTCCILHNICLDSGDQLDEDEQGLLHQLREDIDDPNPAWLNNQDAFVYRDMICVHI